MQDAEDVDGLVRGGKIGFGRQIARTRSQPHLLHGLGDQRHDQMLELYWSAGRGGRRAG